MLTVMTINVGNGLAPPERLTRFLRLSGAELIGLQELDELQATSIEGELLDTYPYQVLYGTGFSGRGLISRYPITEHQLLEILPGRPDLRARIELPSTQLTIVVAHPPPPGIRLTELGLSSVLNAQIEELLRVTVARPPLIIMGDFNMTSRSLSYALLSATGLIDAFRTSGTGRGATFPVRPGRIRRMDHRMSWVRLLPFMRIDYIWHTNDIESLAAWVGPDVGSDHLPVFARVDTPSR